VSPSSVKLRVTGDGLRLREQPDTKSKIIRTFDVGDVVTQINALRNGEWRQVRTVSGEIGWVSGKYVQTIPAWRTCKALVMLGQQIDQKYPRRNKQCDGTIGDAAHQSRDSDHNPWVKDENGIGVVTARDITHDSSSQGPKGQDLVDALVKSQDPRIKYIIFNRRIWRSYDRPARNGRPAVPAWHPDKYTGTNPHTQHVHISVGSDPDFYDSTRPWSI
jgi:hypothetical protein